MDKAKLINIIEEEIKSLLSERFVNLFGKEKIEPYLNDIWNIMQKTYEPVGGFKTASSPEELLNKVDFAKLVRKNNKIIAAVLYKDKLGRKSIALGSDGSEEGVKWVKQIAKEDVNFQRSWGEFSGKAESLMLRYGGVPILNDLVGEILGKEIISKDPDGFHYTRMIQGTPTRKIMIGNMKNLDK
jgi:hypothetical protein